MIYHSTQSNDYLWYWFRVEKKKKTKTHPIAKFLPIFSGRNNDKHSQQAPQKNQLTQENGKNFNFWN